MKEHTKIAVIIDKSGSMGDVVDDTIGGFNQFLKTQRETPGTADISVYQFDDVYEVTYENKAVGEAPELGYHNYCPRGSTALLDAIGRTVNSLGATLSALPEQDRPNKVIVVVVTDGYENASREFNRQQIADLIKQQEQVYSWEFVYLGATLDAVSVAHAMGFKCGSAAYYAAAAPGKAFNTLGTKVASYRGMSKGETEQLTSGGIELFNDEDREELA